MKILTVRRVLVQLKNVPFNAKMFDLLVTLSVLCPNLALEAVEVHTNAPVFIRLFQLDLDWKQVQNHNLDAA